MKIEKLPQLANFLDVKIAEMKGLLTKKSTYFNNPCLKNCKIVSYNQGQYNKFLKLDNFDEVFWISNTGNYINAIGYLNRIPTILKLKKTT